jgi:hypothetical protein
MADSRSLEGLAGKTVRLAGLLAWSKEFHGADEPVEFLSVEDEFGLADIRAPEWADPLRELEGLSPLVVCEGRVEARHGAATLVASRLDRFLPGGSLPAGPGGALAAG